MTILAIVLAFALEQWLPLPATGAARDFVTALADRAEARLNAGERRHGMYAWFAVVGGAALLVTAVYVLAASWSWFLALAWMWAVLYLTMGFRQFSHWFSEIQDAMLHGDVERARLTLTTWKRGEQPRFDASGLERSELIRQALEFGLFKAQRHVFGVLFWVAATAWLVGPAGAVVYRLAAFLAERWNRPAADSNLPADRFGAFAQRAWQWIEWVPARLTAIGFAIVGDFEATLFCWRRVAGAAETEPLAAGQAERRLLLAATSGAIGTCLLAPAQAACVCGGNEGIDLAEPQPRTLVQASALVWRAVLLWLGFVALLSLVAWAAYAGL